ncbi:uncharacterized protein Nmag_1625 [Natrialba magadii ATCC 43099]|nr:hypothetical protein [Natrialba magadii]ADD05201.2 uncharacterized protein Nmag_1625 [Natrialba magadii ATCC 43099]
MQRRKFVLGMGALATGSAAAFGTGAFSSVEAHREVTVEFEGDSEAYLGLSGDDTYVTDDTDNSRLTIDIGGGSGTEAGGQGLNEYAVTTISDIVQITNQGTETVGVQLDHDDVNENVDFFISDSAADSGDQLEPGQHIWLGVQVDDTDGELSDSSDGFGNLRITTGIEEEGPEPAPEPEPPEPDPASVSGTIDHEGFGNLGPTGFDPVEFIGEDGDVVATADVEDTDGASGSFAVDELGPGDYTIEVFYDDGMGNTTEAEKEISLAEGESKDVVIEMPDIMG